MATCETSTLTFRIAPAFKEALRTRDNDSLTLDYTVTLQPQATHEHSLPLQTALLCLRR